MGQLLIEREQTSPISQAELVDKYVLPYLRDRATKDRNPPHYWLKEITYYERLLERLRWFDELSNTLLQALSALRDSLDSTMLLGLYGSRFHDILAHLSFQIEQPPILTQDLDTKVQKFTNKRLGWGTSLPQLDPEPLPAIEFLHSSCLSAPITQNKSKIYEQLFIPTSRLRPLWVHKQTKPISKNPGS